MQRHRILMSPVPVDGYHMDAEDIGQAPPQFLCAPTPIDTTAATVVKRPATNITTAPLPGSSPPAAPLNVGAVHFNLPLSGKAKNGPPTMAPGKVIRVHDPHSRVACQEFPSEQILETQGSLEYIQSIVEGLRVFHCTHFVEKKVCKRGQKCTFIHALGEGQTMTEELEGLEGEETSSSIKKSIKPASSSQNLFGGASEKQRGDPENNNKEVSKGTPPQQVGLSLSTKSMTCPTDSSVAHVHRNDPYSFEAATVNLS